MSEAQDAPESSSEPKARDPRINLLLFVITLVTVFGAGRVISIGSGIVSEADATWLTGWRFAVPFLGILVCHEFGHWFAARLHRVPASLPYFIPLPQPVGLFGTMGAVIVMPPKIKTRNALLDIGAAGPIAGMVVAVPVVMLGLHLSEVQPLMGGGYAQEGQSILYWALKWIVLGPMPEGHDVYLHPTAFAGWGGFLVTMINMLPWGQLDGGHVAYALLGPKQNRVARFFRYSLLPLFAYNAWLFIWPVAQGESSLGYGEAIPNSMFWLVWFGLTALLARASGSADHPPCDEGQLSPTRKWVAIGTLLLFVLLFMPTPFALY